MASFWMYVSVFWGAVIKKMWVGARGRGGVVVVVVVVVGYENYLHDFVAV